MAKIFASPKAKAMAKAHNLELASIPFSGIRMTSVDVQNFLNSGAKPAPAAQPQVAAPAASAPAAATPKPVLFGTREKIAPIRKAIAKAMRNS